MILNKNAWDVEHIVNELYSGWGCVHIPQAITPQTLTQLQHEARAAPYTVAPKRFCNALQEFSFCHLGEHDEYTQYPTSDFPTTYALHKEYTSVYNKIVTAAQGDTQATLSSIILQKYTTGSLGITPHMDHSTNKNVVTIFVLEGNAQFGIATDREKSATWECTPHAGDALLLRAPRNNKEKELRPMHYVGEVANERYSLALRARR